MELILKCKDKEFRANGYKLTLGNVEDIFDIIDLDAMIRIYNDTIVSDQNPNTESLANENDYLSVAKAVTNSFEYVKSVLLDIFTEMTPEDVRNASIEDVIQVIYNIITDSIATIKLFILGKKK